MSAGAFQIEKYQDNTTTRVYPIRVQPETLAATFGGTANAVTTDPVTEPTFAQISRSNGGYGVRPRKVTVRFTAAPPTGYKADQTYSIPILTAALWDSINPASVGEYLGVATVVVSKAPESVR